MVIRAIFSEAVTEPFSVDDFVFVNCRAVRAVRISATYFEMSIVPIVRKSFNITLPAGVYHDETGQGNLASSTAWLVFVSDLVVNLYHQESLFVTLALRYNEECTVYCMATESVQVPESCQAIQAAPLSSFVNISSIAKLNYMNLIGFAFGHSYSVYCCALETAYGIQNTNSIESTRVAVAIGWGDCPVVDDRVCSGHGTCHDGTTCVCDAGYYEDDCARSCPGLLADGSFAIECNGHGVCGRDDYACTCESSQFVQPDCSPLQLTDAFHAAGRVFLYLSFTLRKSSTASLYLQQQAVYHSLRALASTLNVTAERVGMRRQLLSTSSFDATAFVDAGPSEGKLWTEHCWSPSFLSAFSQALRAAGEAFMDVEVTNVFVVSSSDREQYTCYDGLVSEDETDVDCGGTTCSKRCQRGKRCVVDSDCESFLCSGAACQLSASQSGIVRILLSIAVVVGVIVLVVVLMLCSQCSRRASPKRSEKSVGIEMPEVVPEVVPEVHLKTDRKSEVKHVDSEKVKHMDSDKLKHVDSDKLKHVDSEKLKHVDSEKVKHVDSDKLKHADSEKVKHVDSEKLTHVDSDKLTHANSEKLNPANSDKLKYLNPDSDSDPVLLPDSDSDASKRDRVAAKRMPRPSGPPSRPHTHHHSSSLLREKSLASDSSAERHHSRTEQHHSSAERHHSRTEPKSHHAASRGITAGTVPTRDRSDTWLRSDGLQSEESAHSHKAATVVRPTSSESSAHFHKPTVVRAASSESSAHSHKPATVMRPTSSESSTPLPPEVHLTSLPIELSSNPSNRSSRRLSINGRDFHIISHHIENGARTLEASHPASGDQVKPLTELYNAGHSPSEESVKKSSAATGRSFVPLREAIQSGHSRPSTSQEGHSIS